MPPRQSKDPLSYHVRNYRHAVESPGLSVTEVRVRETDLFIASDNPKAYDIALRSVLKYRTYLEEYIKTRPEFLTSLEPLADDAMAPSIVAAMIRASRYAGVGPMAAVAGAIAEFVGSDLLQTCSEVLVENGGDIFLSRSRDVSIGVFAGESPLSRKLTLRVRAEQMPVGVCTSSATVGHSLSLGRADAVCVLSKSTALADAAATAVGNRVNSEKEIRPAIEFGSGLKGVEGILIIIGAKMGAWGSVELV